MFTDWSEVEAKERIVHSLLNFWAGKLLLSLNKGPGKKQRFKERVIEFICWCVYATCEIACESQLKV